MQYSLPIDAVMFAREFIAGVTQMVKSQEALVIAGEYTRWTYAVKRWLAQSAKENDCYAIFTESGKSNEFMLDLVWWKQGRPSSALLACESEWGNSRHPEGNPARVAEDFDKLLSFKAPFKLMIFEADADSALEGDTIQSLNRYLVDYADHRIGEQYLVVNFCKEPKAWLCPIGLSGHGDGLELLPLGSL